MTENIPLSRPVPPEFDCDEPQATINQKTEPGNSAEYDEAMEEILHWFHKQSRCQERFGQVFRKAIDEVLDGQRTGRFDLYSKKRGSEVEKTEKTYLGTKIEIVTRAEFNIQHGDSLDYEISGHQVDAKFTIGNTWTIPKEAMGQVCLLMRANDRQGTYQVGLLRITETTLNKGKNGDQKRSVSASARDKIRWIVKEGKLPKNLLLHLQKESPEKVNKIFQASDKYRGGGNGGQLRVNELFRQATGLLVDRTTLITVATQHDGPKRARDARKHLRREGIVVLGHMKPSPRIAKELRLPVPKNGFWVSAKLALISGSDTRPSTIINGLRYGLWKEGDTSSDAPDIRESTQRAVL